MCTIGRGWTEIGNIGEFLKIVYSYLYFLKKYVSESRSPDRPHVAITLFSRFDGVPHVKCSSVTCFNAMAPFFDINRRRILQ